MRTALLLGLALTLGAGPASANPPTAAASLFAERTALLAGDARCRLLSPDLRTALVATTGQARAEALRDGWTAVKLEGVRGRAASAGGARSCDDAQLLTAAKSATAGFKAWAHMPTFEAKGRERTWVARRTPDPAGFHLVQAIPGGSKFGIIAGADGERLVLAMPAAKAPATVRILLRDRARAPQPVFDVPGMPAAKGLAGAAPPRSMAAARLPSARVIDRRKGEADRLIFTFPSALLTELAALDPREAVTIELLSDAPGAKPAVLHLEVGDLAVACAFLAVRPPTG